MTALADSSALLIGVGGLGCPAAEVLARSGIGRLGLVDADVVSISNLHRQLLYIDADEGRAKVEVAKARLLSLAPALTVDVHASRLDVTNAERLFLDYDVVLDGTDSFATRFLCNDVAILTGTPLVHAGVVRRQGQVLTVLPGRGPCFRCLFSEPPAPGEIPTCAEAGIEGPVAGVIGALQAAEALKVLSGEGEPLSGRLLTFDVNRATLREVRFSKDPSCSACGASARLSPLLPERYAEATCAA